ncbi:XRE family transcriptional regulator [Amycolatopsis sp. YIM 10]|uniref:XRE family transcriptional regulator n=1 Tax=Amycolatopsis sp. YIM 10 TaxID=2653857 RepID=UPI00129084DD|nr:XRE family transcriptional regulator [Amycolatopsis sp. YIM 10]
MQDYIAGRVRAQRVEVFERVADGLRIPGKMFNLAPRPWEAGGVSRSDVTSPSQPENGEAPVLRREFVKLGAGLAAGTFGSSVAGRPSAVSGSRIGLSALAELRANSTRLRSLDDHLGGAETYRLYVAEVQRTAALLKAKSFSGEIRRELLQLFAEQAQQAGWAAFDAGWHEKAARLYDTSYAAARDARNEELAGNALAHQAYQLVSTGKRGVDATNASVAIARATADPAVKSLLYQRAAWTHALAGDARRTGELLGFAENALTLPFAADQGPGWAAWAHTPTELQIMAGRCWTELHKPLRAVPVLENAMTSYADSHARDKALYLSWLSEAYIDAGEVEQAAAVANRALDLSAGIASPRPAQRLDAVIDRFAPYRAAAEVEDLLARRPINPGKVGL